jgi:hypothetical protein
MFISTAETVPSDQSVVAVAATRLAVPRVDVPPELYSYVLHAPMELLARWALLPYVQTEAREKALARIDALVAGYERVPPQNTAPVAEFPSVAAASDTLLQALADRDPVCVDATAAWLDAHVATADIAQALAPHALPALAAAGHANIYIGLLGRASRGTDVTSMLRPVAGALVSDPAVPIVVPFVRRDETATARLLELLVGLGDGEPAPLSFIAPLVHDAARRGVLDLLCESEGIFAAPDRKTVELLRVAAQAMLQGPSQYAAYGWTHCLTLAQGALRAGRWAGDLSSGAYVAAAYIAAHIAAYAGKPLDLEWQPEPTPLGLEQALRDCPASAASAAWHAPGRAATVLATVASVNHDAHRVKYTLACLEAAAADPAAERLYLSAAAHLNAWWEAHPDVEDPEVTGSDG